MCVTWTDKWHESQEDQIAYKLVIRRRTWTTLWLKEKYHSTTKPLLDESGMTGIPYRILQQEDENNPTLYAEAGEILFYKTNTVMTDDGANGFYLFVNKPTEYQKAWEKLSILKVRIPAGTEVRHGIFQDEDSINAKKIEVIEQCV